MTVIAHFKARQAKLEENIVILKADKYCAEKHVIDVEKREESFLKEKMIYWRVLLRNDLRKKRKL